MYVFLREILIIFGVKVIRIIIIFVVIIIVFIISFFFFLLVMILYSIIKDIEKGMLELMMVFIEFCVRIYFLNNVINLLIYSVLNRKFRYDVK